MLRHTILPNIYIFSLCSLALTKLKISLVPIPTNTTFVANPVSWWHGFQLSSFICRHLVFAGSSCLETQVHRVQCHLFSQISSLSPSCHLSAWQHKVMASRCNQDYMLVTHFMHSAARRMWNRHKIKPANRWKDKLPLNIHRFFKMQKWECCL